MTQRSNKQRKTDKEMNRWPNPWITILTASFNGAKTIEHTIQSIRSQSIQNIQHIVVDGGSTDGTLKILRSYKDSYNLFWISEPDEGIADALNKGLRFAMGEYLLVLQTDDYLLSQDSLEKAWEAIQKCRADFHIFPAILDHPQKTPKLLTPFPFLWWNHFKFIFCHQGCFVNRRIFENIGGYRKEFAITFDYDFFYRALNAHCTVKFENFPIALMGATGISSNPSYLYERLREEYRVQKMNEEKLFWGMAQYIFRAFYIPYKRWITNYHDGSSNELKTWRKHRTQESDQRRKQL